MSEANKTCHVLNQPFKSAAISIIFTLVLGPIGLLYSSFWGGIIFTVLVFLAVTVANTHPVIVWFFWLLCTYIGVWAVHRYNKKLLANYEKQ